jgi:hypothetical protein
MLSSHVKNKSWIGNSTQGSWRPKGQRLIVIHVREENGFVLMLALLVWKSMQAPEECLHQINKNNHETFCERKINSVSATEFCNCFRKFILLQGFTREKLFSSNSTEKQMTEWLCFM